MARANAWFGALNISAAHDPRRIIWIPVTKWIVQPYSIAIGQSRRDLSLFQVKLYGFFQEFILRQDGTAGPR